MKPACRGQVVGGAAQNKLGCNQEHSSQLQIPFYLLIVSVNYPTAIFACAMK